MLARGTSADRIARLLGDCLGLLAECNGLLNFRSRRFYGLLSHGDVYEKQEIFPKNGCNSRPKRRRVLRRDGKLCVFSACHLTSAVMQPISSDPWNSLELAKVVVGILTPLSVVLLGWMISRNLKRLDLVNWRNPVVSG